MISLNLSDRFLWSHCWRWRAFLQKCWNLFYQDFKRAHSTQNTLLDPERLSRRNKRSKFFSQVGNLRHQFRRKESEQTADSGSQPGVGTRSSAIEAVAAKVGFWSRLCFRWHKDILRKHCVSNDLSFILHLRYILESAYSDRFITWLIQWF